MPLLKESDVRSRAAKIPQEIRKSIAEGRVDSAAVAREAFDVFLSHSSNEPDEILLGIVGFLDDRGLSVYVDRYHDPQLSPSKVTKETARLLRARMRQSKSLLYVYSQHSQRSRWMPWELGYFDAYRGNVGIVPVTKNDEDTFKGEEYLNLYPYVDEVEATLWINDGPKRYTKLIPWIRGASEITSHP